MMVVLLADERIIKLHSTGRRLAYSIPLEHGENHVSQMWLQPVFSESG